MHSNFNVHVVHVVLLGFVKKVIFSSTVDAKRSAPLGSGTEPGQDSGSQPGPIHFQGVCPAAGVHVRHDMWQGLVVCV